MYPTVGGILHDSDRENHAWYRGNCPRTILKAPWRRLGQSAGGEQKGFQSARQSPPSIVKGMILRIAFIVFIALASTVRPVAHGLQIQMVQTGVFLRSTIETYPEAEARPILTFLDQGRVVADDATRDLLAGRNAEVFGRIQETARQMGQSVDADGAIEQIKAMYGTVTSVEYRAQGIVGFGNNPDVHDLSKVHAATWYAVRSTTHSSEGLYLQISTLRLKGVTLLAAVTFSTYLGNVPPWLKPAAGTERNDGKRVRAVLSAQPDQLAQITLEYGSGVTESGSYAKAGTRHRVETGPQTGSERVVWLFDGDNRERQQRGRKEGPRIRLIRGPSSWISVA